jgi:hypothetical protein
MDMNVLLGTPVGKTNSKPKKVKQEKIENTKERAREAVIARYEHVRDEEEVDAVTLAAKLNLSYFTASETMRHWICWGWVKYFRTYLHPTKRCPVNAYIPIKKD